MIALALPWPSRTLHPNARPHWRKLAQAKQSARLQAGWLTREAGGCRGCMPEAGPLVFEVTFCPPDKRKRDDDGLIASLKAARDGIAQTLGVDDHRFQTRASFGSVHPGGQVIVRVMTLDEAAREALVAAKRERREAWEAAA